MVYRGPQASVFLKDPLSDSNMGPGWGIAAAGPEDQGETSLEGMKLKTKARKLEARTVQGKVQEGPSPSPAATAGGRTYTL